MTKDERQAYIETLAAQGLKKADIITTVAEASEQEAEVITKELEALIASGTVSLVDADEADAAKPDPKAKESKAKESKAKKPAKGQKAAQDAQGESQSQSEYPSEELEDGSLLYTGLLTDQERKDKRVAKGRKDEYLVKVNEIGYVHAEIEAPQFNPLTAEKVSTPRVVKILASEWPKRERDYGLQGYRHIRVIHKPKPKPKA